MPGDKRRDDNSAMPAKREGGSDRAVGAETVEAAALDYLGRYASSSANLRRVLMRRVARWADRGRVDATLAARWVEDILVRYHATGLLDDRAYAGRQAVSLGRRGVSAAGIRFRLRQKGVDEAFIRAALAARRDEGGGELEAACVLARRRRLGPYRPQAARAEFRDRDRAVLARAGFALDIARRVLAAASPDALEALVREAAEE